MATYFHGNPEIQAPDGLQTLVLMNPAYVQYSDTNPPPPNNLVFHAPPPPHTQQFVGVPLPATSTANQDPPSHEISPLHGLVQRVHYNLYNPIDLSVSRAQQGLSLSLSSQQQQHHHGYGSHAQAVSGEDMRVSGGSGSSGSGVTNGVSGVQSVLLSSKFLKAAQELLDEVVNVNNTGITKNELAKKGSGGGDNSNSSRAIGESAAAAGDADGEQGPELTTAERQEIQMKKAKLISMLDEV